jgi:hypothetical protein
LAASPAVALVVVGGFSSQLTGQVVVFALGVAGIAACALVRDAGKDLQLKLWADWGGNPAVNRLRWRTARDAGAVDALHRDLQPLLSDVLPSASAEASDPAGADVVYERSVGALRELTRDHGRFPLVFFENADYGFRRNALGLRRIALAVAGCTLVLSVAGSVFKWPNASWISRWTVCAAISAAAGLFWWFAVTPSWVRRAAETYVDRLMESVQTLRSRPKS